MINSINQIFGFDYNNSINIETWEDALLTYTNKDIAGVYVPYMIRLSSVLKSSFGE